jgi:adenylate cyclase
MIWFLTVRTIRSFGLISGRDKISFVFDKFQGDKKVTENTKIHPITIDLNEFKLHIALKNRNELTLHFNSPSRKFYLTVIAFVANEMKKLGKITSIPLEGNYDLLALLNNTIGEAAGSSGKEYLLPRIYRKWKDVLPNLEEGPLFKVLGKKKEYEEGVAKAYHFTEAEKDNWANLFEYKGSEEHVRLKFAIDRIGAGIDDVAIIYEDAINGEAWERFISNLNGKVEKAPEIETTEAPSEVHEVASVSPPMERTTFWQVHRRKIALVVMIVVIAGAATLAVWKLSSKPTPVKSASPGRMAFPLPDKPSIAVLPFVNMSKDPEQEFFSDGLTEEIINILSKSPYLFVVARTSTFAYKGKSIRVDQVAQELGVRYVLEGSVRRAGDQVRISAKLIDAKTGHNQWAEQYDGNMRDVFAIQDEIASKITKTLQVKLRVGPDPSESRGGSKNAEAYLKSLEANQQILSCTGEGRVQARRLFEEVIALEPDFSRGYSGLALCYGVETHIQGRVNPLYRESMARAIDLAQKAVSLNEKDAINHAVLAYLFALTKQYDKAIVQAERALALEANSFLVLNYSACVLMYSCRGKEALAVFEKAERLNPSYPFMPSQLSWVYLLLGRYEEALQQAQKAVERTRHSPFGQLYAQILLATTCNLTGREAEARAAAGKVLVISPNFSVENWQYNLAFKNNDQINLAMNALRKAGLR